MNHDKLPKTKGEATVERIEKLGRVTIGCVRFRGKDMWYATAFKRDSNILCRGDGDDLYTAIKRLSERVNA